MANAAGCNEQDDRSSRDTVTPPASRLLHDEPERAKTPAEVLREEPADMEDYEKALELSLPLMADTVDSLSPGAIEFARWSAEHLNWEDVRKPHETSIKLVLRDPNNERGKRLCRAGRLVSIERTNLTDEKLWRGVLSTRNDEVIHFLSAGSARELVKGSSARFFSVVTGRHSYSNVGNGHECNMLRTEAQVRGLAAGNCKRR